jgi:hypothetical protein
MGTGSFLWIKRPGRGAGHPPSSAEVKKGYSYTSIRPVGQFRPVTGVLYHYLLYQLVRFVIEYDVRIVTIEN